ncbi:MAG TPA: PspC domain-containing protein [Steroidobacteraceae bacterium]|nr:PspC domain-containing protein [Steroidobacteraceae bacterium]
MQRVITVSLNGNAYQLEDDAYPALAAYLEESMRALAANPDKDEIMADLEQAIADKCARYLNPHKTVLARAEIAQVIAEMGPVADEASDLAARAARSSESRTAGGPTGAGAATPEPAPRRLYQISEGAIVSGVCNGIAAYFKVDVTLVRVIFVALLFLTGGAALLGYLVLMFVVPYASTSEEHAEARGLPFNARALVERAKQKYSEFRSSPDWRRSRAEWRQEWRRARAEWRLEWRRARAEWRAHRRAYRGSAPFPPPPVGPAPAPVPYAAHVVAGTLLAVLGLVLALFTIGWLLALASLVMTGAVFGWPLPHDVPVWVAIVALLVLYNLVAWPIKAARRAAYYPRSGYHAPWVAAWDSVVGLAILAALLSYAYGHVPEVHDFFDHLRHVWDHSFDSRHLDSASRLL